MYEYEMFAAGFLATVILAVWYARSIPRTALLTVVMLGIGYLVIEAFLLLTIYIIQMPNLWLLIPLDIAILAVVTALGYIYGVLEQGPIKPGGEPTSLKETITVSFTLGAIPAVIILMASLAPTIVRYIRLFF